LEIVLESNVLFEDDEVILVVANNLFAVVKDHSNPIIQDVAQGILLIFELVLQDKLRLLDQKRKLSHLISQYQELRLSVLKKVTL
jgi:hypothetical protein